MRNESVSPTTQRRPRRTLNRLALALAALGVGLAGQSLWRQGSVWEGLALTLISGALFWRAAKTHPPTTSRMPAPLAVATGWQRAAGASLLALAVLASLLSLRFFNDATILARAWAFYGGSLLALVAGACLLAPAESPFAVRRLRSPTTLALGVILLAALALRLWQFNNIPFGIWYDEAEAGLQARQWLANPSYRPVFYVPINISGQLLWLYSLALGWVSNTVWGMRLVSVLFGVGGVLAAFLFGRELRGTRFGLMLAFLLAVMRWDINFSRIAMTGIDTPFFELLALFFLTRALKRNSLRAAIFAGLALGGGLSFYTAFRLFVVALGIFAVLAVVLKRPSPKQWKTLAVQFAALAIAAWFAAMPVVQFAVRHPDSYWARVRTTSILNRRDDPNLPHALFNSTLKHAKMFTIHGDNNGRHNLPGEPELDPLMGVLFIFGLMLALKNLRRAENGFFLLLLPIGLAGGIFSLDFEAPQSLRSIAVIPAVVYFSALPLAWLIEEGRQTLKPLSRRWKILPVGLTALYLLAFNAHTYFVRQASDFAVWNAFSTPETIAGKKMAALGADTDYFLSPFLANHPTIQFLAPNATRTTVFKLPDALPIRTDATRPAALFIHPDDGWVFIRAQQLYPAGKFNTVSNAPNSPPAVHTVELSPADISAVQGVTLKLWHDINAGTATRPAQAVRAETITAPPSLLAPPFTAVWEGTLYAPKFGTYTFWLNSPAQTLLEIDGFSVLVGSGTQSAQISLAAGNHHLRVAGNFAADLPFSLMWEPPGEPAGMIPRQNLYLPPVAAQGLLGEYFPNDEWAAPPALARIDPFLDIYFHLPPLPRPYTVRWSGSLVVPQTGVYRLQLRTVGNAQLFVDGQPVLHTNMAGVPFEQILSLSAGLHPLEIKFLDNVARSEIRLTWTPPNEEVPRPIPPENLLPPAGSAWQPFVQTPTAAAFEPKPLSFDYRMTLADGLREPRDIAVGVDGTIYVADSGIVGVHTFAANGTTLGVWTETGDGAFLAPFGVVAAPDGSVWVLDADRQQVFSFSADGSPSRALGTAEAQLYHPRGLSLFTDENDSPMLAIANTGTGNLVFFGLDGTLRGKLGTFGDAPGQFNEPVDVLRDSFGTYFVTEGANANRWQRVDALGNPLATWETPSPVAFDGSHLAATPDGSILMTNSQLGVVQRFAPDGTLMEEWRSLGEVTFQRPVGIFMDEASGQLFIADIGAGVVYVFGVAVEG